MQLSSISSWEVKKIYSLPLVPNLTLGISPPEIIETNPSYVSKDALVITLHREKDDSPRPLIFKWQSAAEFFNPSTLGLFRIISSGKNSESDVQEKQEIQLPVQDNWTEPQPFIVGQSAGGHVIELGPDRSMSFKHNFPNSWRQVLVVGETYELFWKGAKPLVLWDWGSVDGYMGKRLEVKEETERIHVRYGSSGGTEDNSDEPAMLMRFTAVEKYQNLEPVITSLDIDPDPTPQGALGAPILSVSLEFEDSSGELKLENQDPMMDFRVTVTYHGVGTDDPASARPITFHYNIFDGETYYALYRCRYDEYEVWESCGKRSVCYGFVDELDVEVNVADNEKFVSLRPGESWTTTDCVDNTLWKFPEDLHLGDMFRFVFKGATIDWWDWGSKDQAHTQTVVTVPSFPMSSVVNPADNDGRPEIVVPASNQLEFVLVD